MNSRKFIWLHFTFTILFLLLFALPTIIVDPCFHYHAPHSGNGYLLNDARYQNDGITRHFSYDALITGSSMTENTLASEVDSLFGVHSIKVCYEGGSYHEISDNIRVGLTHNPELKTVFWGTDLTYLMEDKDADFHGIEDYNYKYPWYMVDENPLNDVSYVFNKTIFLDKTLPSIQNIRSTNESTSFDEYTSWAGNGYVFGKDEVIRKYDRPLCAVSAQSQPTQAQLETVYGNVRQNIIQLALDYPDTTFYIYIPPYNVLYWDNLIRNGDAVYYLEAQSILIEECVKVPNIKLFAYGTRKKLVTNLDTYMDTTHYNQKTNSKIFKWIKKEKGLLTQDNYESYLSDFRDFYLNYDYEQIFKEDS